MGFVAHDTEAIELRADGYESLALVLRAAFSQAAEGKGRERHAGALPFDEQPMQRLCDLYGPGFALGQAGKKMQEAQRLPHDRAVAELLGAINYIAGAIIYMERHREPPPVLAAAAPMAANDNHKCACGMMPAGQCSFGPGCNDG